jgi:hypothetical protein
MSAWDRMTLLDQTTLDLAEDKLDDDDYDRAFKALYLLNRIEGSRWEIRDAVTGKPIDLDTEWEAAK